jgi:POT family proton-dependent oligopeptide transporter
MMGLAFMSLFVANDLIGWIGGFYEKMAPVAFWGLHAAIPAGGGLLVLLLGRPLERILSGAAEQPLRPSAQTLEVER